MRRKAFSSSIVILVLALCVNLVGCVPKTDSSSATTLSEETSSVQTTQTATSEETSAAASETTQETTAETTQVPASVRDYFPLTPDVFYDYAGTGNEFVPMTAYVEYVWPDMIQMVYDNGGTEFHTLYSVRDGQVRVLYDISELYARQDLTKEPLLNDGEILLQEPLEVGTSWLVGVETRTITGVDVSVDTPAGTFSAIEVTGESEDAVTKKYYAEGIGYIKMTVTGQGYEITQELQDTRQYAEKIYKMDFYYPRMTDTDIEIMYKNISVPFMTNENLSDVLTDYFQMPVAEDLAPVMGQNSSVNSVRLDPATNIVTIDLSANYVAELNVGASMEGAVLRCLVNTVASAYGVQDVIVTLDGAMYESGHIALAPGETFKCDYEGVIELP